MTPPRAAISPTERRLVELLAAALVADVRKRLRDEQRQVGEQIETAPLSGAR